MYGAAFFANLTDIRSNLRSVTLSSVGLVLATMAAVAVVAHAVIDGIPWAAAFTLGAIVSPTDPLAGAAIMRRLELPRRLVNGIEGEGLFNDATALVAYKVAIGVVVGGTFSIADAGLRFLASAAGGIAIGLAVGWVIAELRRPDERRADQRGDLAVQRLRGVHPGQRGRGIGRAGGGHDRPVHGDPGAERSSPRGSGCRATSCGRCSTSCSTPACSCWSGCSCTASSTGLGTVPAGELVAYAVAVSAAAILIRLVWFFTMPYLIRLLDRRPSQSRPSGRGASSGWCWRGPARAARCRLPPPWRCP